MLYACVYVCVYVCVCVCVCVAGAPPPPKPKPRVSDRLAALHSSGLRNMCLAPLLLPQPDAQQPQPTGTAVAAAAEAGLAVHNAVMQVNETHTHTDTHIHTHTHTHTKERYDRCDGFYVCMNKQYLCVCVCVCVFADFSGAAVRVAAPALYEDQQGRLGAAGHNAARAVPRGSSFVAEPPAVLLAQWAHLGCSVRGGC